MLCEKLTLSLETSLDKNPRISHCAHKRYC